MPRTRKLPGDLSGPREAIARRMLDHVEIDHELARGPVTVEQDPTHHTVVLAWRSTRQKPARRAAACTLRFTVRFIAGTLEHRDSSIKTQAGDYAGVIHAGPVYEQTMTDLRRALETQLRETVLLRQEMDRAEKRSLASPLNARTRSRL